MGKNICSIHQPSYFPWLGLLNKIIESDVFVLLDTVQLNDAAYQNRNLFLDNQNKAHLLTIPINKKSYQGKAIKDLELSNNIWQKKHSKFIYFNYKKHPFFDEIYPLIEPLYKKEYKYLIDFLLDTMYVTFDCFNIRTEMLIASDLDIGKSSKEDLVLNILQKTNADIYLSGKGAASYQKEENFLAKGIELKYQSFKHPIYPQFKNNKFIEGISCLDYLFNCGKQKNNFF